VGGLATRDEMSIPVQAACQAYPKSATLPANCKTRTCDQRLDHMQPATAERRDYRCCFYWTPSRPWYRWCWPESPGDGRRNYVRSRGPRSQNDVLAVVFLTLQPLLTLVLFFRNKCLTTGGGISTPWLASIRSDVASFVTNFIVGRSCQRFCRISLCCERFWTPHPASTRPVNYCRDIFAGTRRTFNLIQNYNTQRSTPQQTC